MAQSNELALALDFFKDFTKDNRLSLGIGGGLRTDMLAAVKAGKVPTGYRYPWLSSASGTLLRVLSELGERFATAYPGDRCSVEDLLDILKLTADRLEAQKNK